MKNTDIELLKERVRLHYKERCVLCGSKSRIVHEIEPKSKRPLDWSDAKNMVLLCSEHHDWVHIVGTAKCADILRAAAHRSSFIY